MDRGDLVPDELVINICKAEITPEYLSEQWWYTLGDSDLA